MDDVININEKDFKYISEELKLNGYCIIDNKISDDFIKELNSNFFNF
jgi:hypothetical protein